MGINLITTFLCNKMEQSVTRGMMEGNRSRGRLREKVPEEVGQWVDYAK